ncbi:MAG: type I-C CRISPR-associated protein Cas5c, partial [Sulfobacillus sp.]
TPSAARGILEAILWKPALMWHITQIDVLNPIRWQSVRRNEVDAVASTDSAIAVRKAGAGRLGLYVEEHRQQRAGLLLRDVAYTIHARFSLTSKAGAGESVVKFQEMFLRRAERGQCFHRPYLGCREFPADFELIRTGSSLPDPINETQSLGWMLLDLDYNEARFKPRFFRAELKNGRIAIPEENEEGVAS